MARKSKPWAVVLSTPDGPIRCEFRSEAEAYRKVQVTQQNVLAGTSSVTQIRVEKWEGDRWIWFDQPHPEES